MSPAYSEAAKWEQLAGEALVDAAYWKTRNAALVEALESAVAEMEDQLDHLTRLGESATSDGRLAPIYAGGIYHRHMLDAIAKARAALAAAQGGAS